MGEYIAVRETMPCLVKDCSLLIRHSQVINSVERLNGSLFGKPIFDTLPIGTITNMDSAVLPREKRQWSTIKCMEK